MRALSIIAAVAGIGMTPAHAQPLTVPIGQACQNEAIRLYRDVRNVDLRKKQMSAHVAKCVRQPRRFGR